ncbi:MAG TPA: ribosome biogenesis GTPase Der [Longimicrobiales bacterium]|nr:ribosome biogenesis GTPase Der [Longimicrobiales bacterium]
MRRGLPVVAVVGRPNVGKSTFFNRVLGERRAIVEDTPGVTRDRNFARAEWNGRMFYLVDTGGLEPGNEEALMVAIRDQVDMALAESDVIVFLVDGKVGPQPDDETIAARLRRTNRPVVLAVNKLDKWPDEVAQHEFWSLGLGEPHPVSSVVGKGSGDLLDAIVEKLPVMSTEEDDALHIAVVGKPNVGKSSFVNKLLSEERMVVSDVAGTTRDSIDTPYRYQGHDLVFVDTAGLRRQARIDPGLEYYSALRTELAIERSDVCLLLIDATEPVHVQDLKIAEKAWKNGCGLIVIVNKWDLVEKETNTAVAFERALRERARALRHVPVLFTSALTGQRVHKVLDLVLEVQAFREMRIATRQVNEVVRKLAERTMPPHFRGMPVKLLYATQVAVKPPTFVIFTNQPKGVPEHYMRYLQNGFRLAWKFTGTPIRLRLRARREEEKPA